VICLTNKVTPCNGVLIEKIKSHSARQDFPHFLCNPNVNYRVYKSLPPVSVLSQMNPVQIFQLYPPKLHSDIIFLPSPGSSYWSHLLRFSDQNFECISHLSDACYMPLLSHLPWVDHPNDIRLSVHAMKPYHAVFPSLQAILHRGSKNSPQHLVLVIVCSFLVWKIRQRNPYKATNRWTENDLLIIHKTISSLETNEVWNAHASVMSL
jgi:hypothetical protein